MKTEYIIIQQPGIDLLASYRNVWLDEVKNDEEARKRFQEMVQYAHSKRHNGFLTLVKITDDTPEIMEEVTIDVYDINYDDPEEEMA